MLLETLILSPYHMMMNTVSKHTAFMAVFVMSLAGCHSLGYEQGPALPTSTGSQQKDRPLAQTYEAAHNVPADQYLGSKLMHSKLHTVAPMAWNDGYANSYKIETPDHVYVVQGTHQARERIREIRATEILRDTYTVEAVAQEATLRTVNLVETPVRALAQGASRFASVRTPVDALMVVPSGALQILGKLGKGAKEVGVTGARLVSGAATSDCSGFGACATNAGKDLWSGFNSVVGEHKAATRLHQRLGTDPYSDNKVLQRQIARLAYAESYTGTGLKTGVSLAGISVLSPWTSYVGYYNNAEYLAIYEDAYKRQNTEIAEMLAWGADASATHRLYENEAFTPTIRTRMFTALQQIKDPKFRARYVSLASDARTRYVADGRLAIAQYFAELDKRGQIKGYIADGPMAIAINKNNALILPFVADDLHWTHEISSPIAKFARKVQVDPAFTHGEIHVLGHATHMFKQNAQQDGLSVVEYALMP